MPFDPDNKKVVVAMSGGVDSSVAAALLKRDGYDILGAFLRLGSPDGVEAKDEGACEVDLSKPVSRKQGCCSVNDAADARSVAALLDVPFYVLNFQDDFARIIDYFIGEYNAGRTPNPCVRCNDWLKFGRLAKYAEAAGAGYVASGHYARVGVDPVSGERALMRGVDHSKDQSYVLFGMSRETLAHTLLPIGDMLKPAVRQLAEQFGLPTHAKPDSQEICFVPDQDYAGLLKRRQPQAMRVGSIVDTAGAKIGEHEGHQHFTIGQRPRHRRRPWRAAVCHRRRPKAQPRHRRRPRTVDEKHIARQPDQLAQRTRPQRDDRADPLHGEDPLQRAAPAGDDVAHGRRHDPHRF